MESLIVDLAFGFIFSFFATVCFGLLISSPPDAFFESGFCGGISWVIYILLWRYVNLNTIACNFLAALVVGVLAEFFSDLKKNPIIIYAMPGAIPLVPGYALYNTTKYLMEKNYRLAAQSGFNTLFISCVIAGGIIISSSLLQMAKVRLNLKKK